jgi:hypothetical protein
MRYKVILQSINVSHEMFTRDMIPIRTVVQIGLQRLPDLVSGQFSKFKQAEEINKISTVLTSQGVLTASTSAATSVANRRAAQGGFL